MCQLIFIGKEGALCVQDILERSKSLFIEVERKLQCLLPLIDDFPERDNLFDRVLVGIHGIVHFLDSRQYILVELSDRLVELGFCQPCHLRQLRSLEEVPGDGRGDLVGQTVMVYQFVQIMRCEAHRPFDENFRPPV